MNVFVIYLLFKLIFHVNCDVLYTKNDPLIILSNDNFNDYVFGQNQLMIVQFYNSWCGHCIRFVPLWKNFATSVDGWGQAVELGVLDCSVEEHVQLCNHFSIDVFPTIKSFHPFSRLNETGDLLHEVSESVTDLEDGVLNVLEKSDVIVKGRAITQMLSPITSLSAALSNPPTDAQYTVVVFEDDQSTLGKKIILDALDYTEVYVTRILSENLRDVEGITSPSLNLLNKDGTFRPLVTNETERSVYKQTICDLIGVIRQSGIGAGDHPVDESQSSAQVHQHGATIHMQDLESTLHYALRQDIATCPSIADDKLSALKTFIHVVAKYFPGQQPIREFLWNVDDWLQNHEQSLTGSEWLTKIDSLETDVAWLPNHVLWTGCHGSSARFRGYPCGVWTLFHALTVSSLHSDRGDDDGKEVLYAMKAFILNFFGCSECAQNFRKEIRELETKVHTKTDVVLYLWEVHNSVNKRLNGDLTEDPVHPKVQFPTNQMCRKCHVTLPDDSTDWERSEVLEFLEKIYRKENIVKDSKILEVNAINAINEGDRLLEQFIKKRIETKRQIADVPDKIEENKSVKKVIKMNKKDAEIKSSYLGLSSTDISMCVVFYVFCTLLIFVVYYKILVKRKRKISYPVV